MQYHDTFDMMRDPKYDYLWNSKIDDYYRSATRRVGKPKGGNPGPGRAKASNPGKSRKKVEAAMREVFTNIPSTVKRANVTGERRRKMLVAIGLEKARARGAKIPRKPR
jgi:hypothetical protein